MLISATPEMGLRVALVRGKTLYDLDLEQFSGEQKKANIYKGKILHIEASLEAAFVEYGSSRQGFLPIKEVSRNCFQGEFTHESLAHPHIKDVLREGQEILVQIDKEERGTKGAALTTFISLAGSYLVLMPNNPRAGGISRRIEGQGRDDLRDIIGQLNIPEGMGVIIRTAGVGKSLEDLQWDLNTLLKLWESISKASETRSSPALIYQEGDALLRAIRDYLRQEIDEIIVDTVSLYDKTKQYVAEIRPEFVDRIQLHQHKIPLFSFYNIENQIETAHHRVLRLPSGGAIVIDHTEALVSVDVNSAKATGGGDIEETALNTNLEAADEIARQLRLRDIGGLIVIDFIDMTPLKNQREVGDRLREALKFDRARVQVGNITRFGLLEMSRQRLRSSLSESTLIPCPRCSGQGRIRSIESLTSSLLHVIEEEASQANTAEVQVQLPVDLATFLLNEKRAALHAIEVRTNVRLVLLPNVSLETPNFTLKRIRGGEGTKSAKNDSSYNLIASPETKMPEVPVNPASRIAPETPAVRLDDLARVPSPASEQNKEKSKIKHLFTKIFRGEKDKTLPGKEPINKTTEDSMREKSETQLPPSSPGHYRDGNRNRRPEQRDRRRPPTRDNRDRRASGARGGRMPSPRPYPAGPNRNVNRRRPAPAYPEANNDMTRASASEVYRPAVTSTESVRPTQAVAPKVVEKHQPVNSPMTTQSTNQNISVDPWRPWPASEQAKENNKANNS